MLRGPHGAVNPAERYRRPPLSGRRHGRIQHVVPVLHEPGSRLERLHSLDVSWGNSASVRTPLNTATREQNSASWANVLCLVAHTRTRAAVCLHAGHIAAFRAFWTD